jgi:hypothetical protein
MLNQLRLIDWSVYEVPHLLVLRIQVALGVELALGRFVDDAQRLEIHGSKKFDILDCSATCIQDLRSFLGGQNYFVVALEDPSIFGAIFYLDFVACHNLDLLGLQALLLLAVADGLHLVLFDDSLGPRCLHEHMNTVMIMHSVLAAREIDELCAIGDLNVGFTDILEDLEA